MNAFDRNHWIRDHFQGALARARSAPSEQFIDLWEDGFDLPGWLFDHGATTSGVTFQVLPMDGRTVELRMALFTVGLRRKTAHENELTAN